MLGQEIIAIDHNGHCKYIEKVWGEKKNSLNN